MTGFGRAVGLGLVAFTMMAASPALAMRVQPMAYDLTPTGAGASQDLRVENTSDKPMPVELRVERRRILPDGLDKREPADDDFMIFPPQGIVPPNGFQTFRLRYIGDPTIGRTSLYAITVAQLPIDASSDGSTGVQVLFNLSTLAAVSPADAKPAIVVAAVGPAAATDKLSITVRNDGAGYTRLRTGVWTLTAGDGKSEKLEGEPLQNALQQGLIEPGTTRVIELPVSPGFKREGAKATYAIPAR